MQTSHFTTPNRTVTQPPLPRPAPFLRPNTRQRSVLPRDAGARGHYTTTLSRSPMLSRQNGWLYAGAVADELRRSGEATLMRIEFDTQS
jgi:hypothetical protein